MIFPVNTVVNKEKNAHYIYLFNCPHYAYTCNVFLQKLTNINIDVTDTTQLHHALCFVVCPVYRIGYILNGIPDQQPNTNLLSIIFVYLKDTNHLA